MQLNVLEYLENSYREYPQKVAFSDDKGSMTYQELVSKAKAIAGQIITTDDAFNKPIVVFIDRNVLSLASFFGVLYSGNYYVPVDNKMPQNRIANIISQVKPSIILCQDSDIELAQQVSNNLQIELINVSKIEISDVDDNKMYDRRKRVLDIDPVYVIFTSGSTGNPKGIVISHRSVIDFTDWMTNTFDFTCDDVMANQAPFYFDLSVKDIYTTIKNGATCHIISKKNLMFPTNLIDFLNDKKVTSLIWATSAFNLISNSKVFEKKNLKTVNKVILGGEALLAKHLNVWKKANPNISYVNLYGPTEVTVDCTYYKINKAFADGDVIPIGKACENKEVLILDENGKIADVNVSGEICVRGTGLAKGYYEDFEKTKSVFIQNPLNNKYPDILYKTGDIGYLNEDGDIVFCSRNDGQIKHQGYRIELGEIERAINSIEEINSAFCFYDEKNDRIICAYEGEISDEEIIKKISLHVPKYMFPNKMIKLDNMPYNANGKIDRVKVKGDYFSDKNS